MIWGMGVLEWNILENNNNNGILEIPQENWLSNDWSEGTISSYCYHFLKGNGTQAFLALFKSQVFKNVLPILSTSFKL